MYVKCVNFKAISTVGVREEVKGEDFDLIRLSDEKIDKSTEFLWRNSVLFTYRSGDFC